MCTLCCVLLDRLHNCAQLTILGLELVHAGHQCVVKVLLRLEDAAKCHMACVSSR